MSKADELRLVWREKAREAREVGDLWIAVPTDDELMGRALFAWDERNWAWKEFLVAEWTEGTAKKETYISPFDRRSYRLNMGNKGG